MGETPCWLSTGMFEDYLNVLNEWQEGFEHEFIQMKWSGANCANV